MAKTESTAVNELIKLVETQTPLKADPSDDLMFKAPEKPAPKVNPPRLTSTIPNLKGAGPVAPLPRQRTPQGTQRGVPAIGSQPPAAEINSVRVSTAPVLPPLPSLPKIPTDDLKSRPTRPSEPFTTAEGTGSTAALPKKASLPPPRPSGPRVSAQLRTEAPPQTPVAAPFRAPVAPPPFPAGQIAYPSAAPYLPQAVPTDMTSNQAWFDDAQFRSAPVEVEIPMEISGTAPVAKTTDWKQLIPKLIAPTLALVILGVFVGGYFAFDGEGRKHSTDTTNAAEPALAPIVEGAVKAEPAKAEPVAKTEPAAAPTNTEAAPANTESPMTEPAKAEPVATAEPIAKAEPKTEPAKAEPVAKAEPAKTEPAPSAIAPAPVIAGRTTLVDIRIDSKPAGATVMLVDRGKTTFLGTTPIATAVDPSRSYDLVLTYNDRPPQLEHFDPKATKRLSITLDKKKQELPKAAPAPAVAKAVAPKTETPKVEKAEAPKVEKAVEAPKVEKKAEKVEPKKAAPTAPAAPATHADPAVDKKPEPKTGEPKPEAIPTGEGTLMVSSKPPCEIWVDGVPTGLSTPQRALKLPAGKHKITLVNLGEKIKKTIPVSITADQPTKVIENFMK